jgi:hypothetical protein
MKFRIRRVLGSCVLLISAGFGGLAGAQAPNDPLPAGPPPTEGTLASQTPESVIQKWPEGARLSAGMMIGKYGEPTRWSEGALVWIANGPWEKSVVYRIAWPHFIGKRDKDYLEQTIAYRVPNDKIEDLKRFDRRLEVNAGRGQLSSRSESESMNFLALNLADEIATNKRSVEDARDFYLRVEKLAKAGKTSAYTEGLLFPAPEDSGRRINERLGTDDGRNVMP